MDGTSRATALRTVIVRFSEPMDADSLKLGIRVVPIDDAQNPLIPAMTQIRSSGQEVRFTFDVIPPGEYRVEVDGNTVTNRVGNAYEGAANISQFTILEATAIFSNPGGGEWSDPNNWEGGVLPGPDDHVLINLPEDIEVVHNTVSTQVRSISSRNRFTLRGGMLDVTEFIAVENDFQLQGGTLKNATLPRGENLAVPEISFSTFENVVADGNLRISDYGRLTSKQGLTLNGVLTVPYFGTLAIDDTQTLSGNGTIVLSSWQSSIVVHENATLTLGPEITLRTTSYNRLDGDGSVINQGSIVAAGDRLTLSVGTFANDGAVSVNKGRATVEHLSAPGGVLTGSWTVGSIGSLKLSGIDIKENRGVLILDGTNASFVKDDQGTSPLSTLEKNAADAELRLLRAPRDANSNVYQSWHFGAC